MLEKINLDVKLSKRQYKARLPQLQSQLHQLQRCCWEARLGSVIVFEGWEASGRGRAIRKLTERLEPRAFMLHTIAEPRTYETTLPWMWRFWQRLPRYGEMAIFDHSWFGRVLEDRVEGKVSEGEWRRAYEDIVAFARALAEDRYVLVKLFFHIDKKEQKKRLKALAGDPLTRWQVGEHDWRQNSKYKHYLVAVEEMLARTESEWGPWTIIEARDRRWTRVRMFEAVIARLEEGLRQHGLPLPEYESPAAMDAAHEGDLDG